MSNPNRGNFVGGCHHTNEGWYGHNGCTNCDEEYAEWERQQEEERLERERIQEERERAQQVITDES